MKVKVEIYGHTPDDVAAALAEVQKQLSDGFTSGMDRNDTGSYTFTAEGEYVDCYAIALDGYGKKLTEPRYVSLAEAQQAKLPGQTIIALTENGRQLWFAAGL